MNENEKGFGQGKQAQPGDATAQDKNAQFGQGQQAETGQGQQNPAFGQAKDQQFAQDQGQPGGEDSAFFGEGKPAEPGEQGRQDPSVWPEKGQREDEETGAGSGESPDQSGSRY